MTRRDAINDRIDGSLAAITGLREHAAGIRALTEALVARLRAGGTLYTAGNGGSAAQALHLAEELIGRYRDDRPPVRAICLNADPTALTCIANDYGYEHVFSRPCAALLGAGDALVVLSTSGHSENVVQALQVARGLGALAIGLLGGDGGRCVGLCDHAIVVGSDDSAHIQEAHQVVIHLMCELLERELKEEGTEGKKSSDVAT